MSANCENQIRTKEIKRSNSLTPPKKLELSEAFVGPFEKAINKAQECCEQLIATNTEYVGLKNTARGMLNEVDDAALFYEDELVNRLAQCAQVIRQIQKNPAPNKINQMKKNLIV